MIKPKKLKRGDTVAIVSLSSGIAKNLDIDTNREKRDLKKFLSSRLLLCLML